jgi:hypothetical protein
MEAFMGVNHGGGDGEDEFPRIGNGGNANTGCPPDFCHVSKFQALAMDLSPPPPKISTQIYATGSIRPKYLNLAQLN